MQRYVVTGSPGSGKTTILHRLRQRGWAVVGEAATEVIAREQADGVAEPWTDDEFVSKIAALQRERQQRPPEKGVRVQFYDRSPLCTLALARYLGLPITSALRNEIDRVMTENVYQRVVFFVRPLGFVEPSAARRITYREALAFEATHEAVYREHGFEFVDVAAADVAERAAHIEANLDTGARP